MRNSKEVSVEEYNEFYKKTFNEFMDPLACSHFNTEVNLSESVSGYLDKKGIVLVEVLMDSYF